MIVWEPPTPEHIRELRRLYWRRLYFHVITRNEAPDIWRYIDILFAMLRQQKKILKISIKGLRYSQSTSTTSSTISVASLRDLLEKIKSKGLRPISWTNYINSWWKFTSFLAQPDEPVY